MTDIWHPNSSVVWHPKSIIAHQAPIEKTHELRLWTVESRRSSRLLICIFDDEFEAVMSGETTPSTGSDAWWIRFAIESALDHHEVFGVLLSSFSRSTIKAFLDSKSRFDNFSICCLLDIYISDTREAPGVALGRMLVDSGIGTDRIRPFSNGVSDELTEIGIRNRIRKPLNEATPEEEAKFKKEINEAVDSWGTPLRTSFKSNAGIDELKAIGNCLKESFHQKHSQKCHELADCFSNSGECWEKLYGVVKADSQFFHGNLAKSVSDAELLTPSIIDSLFAIFSDGKQCNAAFALSKCLSRFGTEEDKHSVPGHWIELALGVTVSGLEFLQYPIKRFKLQPIFGFLHAIAAVGKNNRLSNASLENRKLTLEILVQNEEGRSLEVLRDRATAIFVKGSRPVGGEWTCILQTFCDSGATLRKNQLTSDNKSLALVVVFDVQAVG